MLAMKFGGTSVGTPERVRQACAIVKTALDRRPLVVVSAANSAACRSTDTLIACAKQALAGRVEAERISGPQRALCRGLGVDSALIDPLLERFERLLRGIAMIGELSDRVLDHAMSFGECMSALVVTDVLRREFGVDARQAPSFDLGLVTDARFGAAQPALPASYAEMRRKVLALGGEAVVTTGFLGATPEGVVTTLGRGGSDYSGTLFGAAVGAEEIQIWTDVDGVMTADPRAAPAATTIPELSFLEASELAWYGAKVLHPATVAPAMEHGIPVRVLNTGNPAHPGTLIMRELGDRRTGMPKSISAREGIDLLTVSTPRMLGVPGFAAKIFGVFGRHQIDVHMIATSEVSISVTAALGSNLDQVAGELRELGEVDVRHDHALVCVVGEGMAGRPGTAAKAAGALASAGVNIVMMSQGASEINMSFLVESRQAKEAVRALHRAFFE